jgi:hypothetical protein
MSMNVAGKVTVPCAPLITTWPFQRLAQHLKAGLAELGPLVEEEDAAVRQADLARTGRASGAHQAGMADRVAGGAGG